MKKPHKHAELIKAWADGCIIQCKTTWGWCEESDPYWNDEDEYRIKPEEKPDVIQYLMTDDKECGNLTSYEDRLFSEPQSDDLGNLYEQIKIVRHADTGKIKSVKAIL